MGHENRAGSTGGFTLVQMLVGLLLTVILIAGIGYFFHMMTPVVRARHTFALQQNAASICDLITRDVLRAELVTNPADPGGGPAFKSKFLTLKWMNDNGTWDTVIYFMNMVSGTITRQVEGQPAGPNLLMSWDDGNIALGTNSTFIRGVDANGDGSLTGYENDMIEVVLELTQMEGPAGARKALKTQVFRLDLLPRGTSRELED